MSLGTAEGDAEAGHDLVEDEDGAMLRAEGAEPFEEARLREDATHVAGHWLDDDGGELTAKAVEERSRCIEVVEGRRERLQRDLREHAGRGGDAEGGDA